jgi:membrane protein
MKKLRELRADFSGGRIAAYLNYVMFTMRRFYEDGMMQSAGALTYSTLLALVPLLVIAFSIFSAFPSFDAVQDQLEALIYSYLLPETGAGLRLYLDRFTSNASNLTAVGVVALALSAILLLYTVEATLNRIWRVERPRPFITRIMVFWALLTLGPLLLGASFTLSSDALAWFDKLRGDVNGGALPQWLRMPFAAAVQAVAFTAVFKLVPASPVRLLDAAIGGTIGGIGFEILKWAFQAFLTNSATYTTVYGAVSAVPIFLIWTYACWMVFILGAVFAASLPDWRRDRQIDPDKHLSPPETLAAAVSLLGVLAGQARNGGGSVDYECFAEGIPLGERDALIESLRSHGYLVETARGRFALARDLQHTTLADLARDLDITLGARSEMPKSPGALPELLARLAEAEEVILGRPLIELSVEPGRTDAETFAAVPLTKSGS